MVWTPRYFQVCGWGGLICAEVFALIGGVGYFAAAYVGLWSVIYLAVGYGSR